MISAKKLLDMVAADANGSGIPDHFFDETRNPNYPQIESDRRIDEKKMQIRAAQQANQAPQSSYDNK